MPGRNTGSATGRRQTTSVPRRRPDPEPGDVFKRVAALLDTVELDSHGDARAAIALTLARKLDEASLSDSGAIAMAIAGISKELRAVLDSILEETSADAAFVADLYAEVGDS